MKAINMDALVETLYGKTLDFGDVLLKVIFILIIGFIIDRYASKVLKKALRNDRFDKTLTAFFNSLVKIFIRFMIIVNVLSCLGVNATTLAAVLASAGAALALGFKNTLGNFTSGITILFMKPFVIGDYIEVGALTGTVKEIQVMSTILNTPENKRVIIPNGNLTTANVINYTAENKRRIDYNIVVDKADLERTKEVVLEVLKEEGLILKKPEVSLDMVSYDLNKVTLRLKYWIKEVSDVQQISTSFLENLYKKAQENNLLFTIELKS